MSPNQTSSAPPDSPDLPNFGDRLPDLTHVLRLVGRELESAKPTQSYIPFFEDVYAVAHSLKGVTRILSCPRPMEEFIINLNVELVKSLSGTSICRNNKEAGQAFLQLADLLDKDRPAETADVPALQAALTNLTAQYTEDKSHEERMKEIPTHLFYVNEFVSKKAREISLLNLNFCVVEDEARLDEVPFWRTQLNEALVSPEFGRGMVVNFLPFLAPEGSRTLKLWAWIAAATYSRAGLKQRVKEIMPKATITKL